MWYQGAITTVASFAIMCAPSGTKNLVSGNILINRKGSFNHGWNLFLPYDCFNWLSTWCQGASSLPHHLQSCWHNVRQMYAVWQQSLAFFEFRTFQEFDLSHIASYDAFWVFHMFICRAKTMSLTQARYQLPCRGSGMTLSSSWKFTWITSFWHLFISDHIID